MQPSFIREEGFKVADLEDIPGAIRSFIQNFPTPRKPTLGHLIQSFTTPKRLPFSNNSNSPPSNTSSPEHRNETVEERINRLMTEHRHETMEEKIKNLEHELKETRRYAAAKDAECQRLWKNQKNLDNEVHDLQENLFQQAYKIADEAEEKKRRAVKLLVEALMKEDILLAEIEALKDVVRAQQPSESSQKITRHESVLSTTTSISEEPVREVDPIVYAEFENWLTVAAQPDTDDTETLFIKRILSEDVYTCLDFVNKTLALEVLEAVQKNQLEIEHVMCEDIKKCELTQVEKVSPYRLRTSSESEWVYISLLVRNRITAVCNIFTYLRYLRNGIIKATPLEAYQEMTCMRKNLALARLGFEFETKMNGTGFTSDNVV